MVSGDPVAGLGVHRPLTVISQSTILRTDPLQVPLRETCGTLPDHAVSAGRERERPDSPQSLLSTTGSDGIGWDAMGIVQAQNPGQRPQLPVPSRWEW